MKKPSVQLLLCEARGIYIPRDFAIHAKTSAITVEGIGADDLACLVAGPTLDNETYWETWDDVLRFASLVFEGNRYTLHQDGDLFLIPEGMEWNDDREMWEWPFEGVSFTGPSAWASYLVNGDGSGLTEDEQAEADHAAQGLGSCLDAIEVGFLTRPDYGLAGDCCEYRFPAQ